MTVRPLRKAATLALACVLALSACSNSDQNADNILRDFGGLALGFIRGGGDATPPGITLTDAQLNAAPVDIVILNAPKLRTEVGLVQQQTNRDVVTWVTPEGYTVSLKGGQIVGTAGFGFDIASADVPNLRDGASRTVRDHYRLQGPDVIRRTRYFCDIQRAGGQTIVVTSRRFVTTAITEDCRTEDGQSVQNRYWIDGRGVIRKSRQFVSPRLGYFELQDVHTGLR